jgi:ribosomal protein S6
MEVGVNRYEAMFILPESVKDEDLKGVLESACEEIKKLDGQIESQTRLGKRPFARKLGKETAGHYVIVTFKLAPDKLSALQARYKLDERIFRVQITRQEKPVPVNTDKAGAKGEGESHGISE